MFWALASTTAPCTKRRSSSSACRRAALGLAVTLTVGLVGGLLSRAFAIHAGVLFMGYYVAVLSVPAILAL
ncbi:hypothetical protein FND50_08935 [Rhodococcus sp. WB9]|uniref:hypothetical protein n=1 Tax=Rhodococcus sp. WB9 TaxID=2594007 RepID=UPI001185BD39|nr:hypothetical protein [Rhodococcus sp. WB9]QDQ90914.1 hypothetical protein FND50_08935 [Rhodococcus sp. WB9]